MTQIIWDKVSTNQKGARHKYLEKRTTWIDTQKRAHMKNARLKFLGQSGYKSERGTTLERETVVGDARGGDNASLNYALLLPSKWLHHKPTFLEKCGCRLDEEESQKPS